MRLSAIVAAPLVYNSSDNVILAAIARLSAPDSCGTTAFKPTVAGSESACPRTRRGCYFAGAVALANASLPPTTGSSSDVPSRSTVSLVPAGGHSV